MLPSIVSLLCIVFFNDIFLVADGNPTKFSFNPGDNFELVWEDENLKISVLFERSSMGNQFMRLIEKNWFDLLGVY